VEYGENMGREDREEELRQIIQNAQTELQAMEKEKKGAEKLFHVRIKGTVEWAQTIKCGSVEAANSVASINFEEDVSDGYRVANTEIASIVTVELLQAFCPNCSALINPDMYHDHPYVCRNCHQMFNEKLEKI
jgi:hypothetical protein